MPMTGVRLSSDPEVTGFCSHFNKPQAGTKATQGSNQYHQLSVIEPPCINY